MDPMNPLSPWGKVIFFWPFIQGSFWLTETKYMYGWTNLLTLLGHNLFVVFTERIELEVTHEVSLTEGRSGKEERNRGVKGQGGWRQICQCSSACSWGLFLKSPSGAFTFSVFVMWRGMCVCVWDRERGGEREKERNMFLCFFIKDSRRPRTWAMSQTLWTSAGINLKY